jgi:iron(III) transport system ATP-binding protein
MSDALSLRHVSRSYGPVRAVRDVSVTAPDRGVLALLGASGSGKSTVLRLIAGLEPVDAGEISLGGQRVSQVGVTLPPEQRRVGLVFQDYALFPHLTAAKNVAFGLNREPKEARLATALLWLEKVGLLHKQNAYPHELSGGEQQRVALARALAPRPQCVLLDEPFSGLDQALRIELRDLTRAIAKDTQSAFVFVTHDAQEALYMADRLGVMAQGRLIQEDHPKQVYEAPVSLAAAGSLGALNLAEGRVQDGAVDTPFGKVAAPQLMNGTAAVVAVRVEALLVSDGDGATVVDRRPQGAFDLVHVTIAETGMVWRAFVPARMAAFSRCAVTLDPRGAFAFAND